MFWGLIMEPNKRYTQTVEKSFHVSMASLDVSTANDEMVQVMLCYDNRNYLLCSLKKGMAFQVPLDLNFQEGTKIAFTSNGCGHVHLTGYLIPEDDDLDLDELEEEDEDEDEDEVPQLVVKDVKRKAKDSPKEVGKNIKRSKQVEVEKEESSDGDMTLEQVLAMNPSDFDDSDSLDEEEDNEENEENEADEEDEEDDEDDEDDSEEEEEEEEEMVIKQQPQKKKNKQEVQQQQPKKQEKQKLVNGKEMKQEQKPQRKTKAELQQQQQQEQKKRSVEGGVQLEETKVGHGTAAKFGKFVTVYYVGRLKNGKKFDSTTQGEGFKFRLGKGEVIKGWDVGIAGMKVGGKRRITIPPAMAYGAKGSPPVIPGNSTLVFEVELKNVH